MQEVQSIDSLLNADLTGTSTAFPVLENQTLDVIIVGAQQAETKKGKPVLNFKYQTAMPAKTREGNVKPAGFPLRDMVSLTPTFEDDGTTMKYNPSQRLAQIKDAVYGNHDGPFAPLEQYIGKTITVRIKIESDPEFGDQNRVAAYIKKAQS